MTSHWPFGHLQLKLWAKEGPGVKLKVGNQPLSDVALKSATQPWKDLNKSYNFDSGLVPIRAWGEELWPLKVLGVQLGHFRDSISGVPTKCAIWM
jgi:hypothetical protein